MARIEAISKVSEVKKGEIIFREDAKAHGFYMVAQGKIKVFKVSFDGKEQILHIYGPGHTFGEVPVFEGKHFPANSMALEKSRVIYLPRDKFVDLIAQLPALSMNMLADLSRRLREFTVQIENLSLKEVPARMAAYLITLSQEQNDCNPVTLPISKVQLANLIGTAPETLSRILKKMAQADLIEVQTKEIHIKDFDGLSELAESGRL